MKTNIHIKNAFFFGVAFFVALSTFAQSTILVPASGSTSVTCGTNVKLKDNGGDNNYANNSNGFVVLQNTGTSVIQLVGTRTIDGNGDALYIYNGSGTGGTLLSTENGSGNINTSFNPGQTITLHFVSNGSVTASGFDIDVIYTGCCAPPPGDTSAFGQNTWNVYAFNGEWGAYYGYYVDNTLNFNTENRWAKTLSPSYASNYQGCGLTTGAHSYKYKRRGFPAGVYTFNLAWTDQFKLFVNGVQVGGTQWNTGSNANFWTGYLDGNSTVEARFLSWNGDSYGRLTATLQAPTYFRTRASGNWNGSNMWQSSTDSINWTNTATVPTVSNNQVVIIQNGHTVSINTNYNNTTALNRVYVMSGGTLNQTGNSQSIIRFARLEVFGTVTRNLATPSFAGTIIVQNGGTYNHALNSGGLPTATWNTGSTLLISGITTLAEFASGDGQTFANINFNSNLSSNREFNFGAAAGFSATGTVTVNNTGSGRLVLTGNGTRNVTVGNLVVNAGTVWINKNNTGNNRSFTVTNMTLNGGSFDFAQDANNTSTLTVLGDLIVNTGATLTNSRSTGTINFHDDVTNTGTITIGSNRVNFVGTSQQDITSNNTIQFHTVTVNNTGGEIMLNSSVTAPFTMGVSNTLTFTSGNINLNNNNIDLGSSGSLVGESETARIYCNCTNGYTRRVMNVSATNTNYTFGNLGIEIKTNGVIMGSTIVKRFNDAFMLPDGSALIKRYFDVEPAQNNGILNVDVTYRYFLAEVDPANVPLLPFLDIYRSTDNGNTWNREFAINNPNSKNVQKQGLNAFSWIGAGTGDVNPLPVELISFDANCATGRMHITWSTASEINNDFFTVERSNDGLIWETISTVAGKGNSNTVSSYEIYDANAGIENYYRLTQTDYNGTSETFEIKSAGCKAATEISVAVYPNPVVNEVNVKVNATQAGQATLTLFDGAGRPVMQQQVNVTEGENIVNIQRNAQWTNGLYIMQVNMQDVDFTQNVKLLFN